MGYFGGFWRFLAVLAALTHFLGNLALGGCSRPEISTKTFWLKKIVRQEKAV